MSTVPMCSVIVIAVGQVCVGRTANGGCRVSCMLIAWMSALVNSSNVFLSIKGLKLRVLMQFVTIDFERRAASHVHYKGALSPYFRQWGHCTNNGELRVSMLCCLEQKFVSICAVLHLPAIRKKPLLMTTIQMTWVPRALSQLIYILIEHRETGGFAAFLRLVFQGESPFWLWVNKTAKTAQTFLRLSHSVWPLLKILHLNAVVLFNLIQ